MIIVPVKEGESIDRALKRYKRKYEKIARTSTIHQALSHQACTADEGYLCAETP